MALKCALFLINGFEETEALVTADILRRGGVQLHLTSLESDLIVNGKHKMKVLADTLFADIADENFDALIVPGGTLAYMEHQGLLDMLAKQYHMGAHLAAICAGPAVFGKLGLLNNQHRASIYPGMESYLNGALLADAPVVTDGKITTAKGPAYSMLFAIRILEVLAGREKAFEVANDFLLPISSL